MTAAAWAAEGVPALAGTGSFTLEQLDRLKPASGRPLAALVGVSGGVSVATRQRVGVLVDPLTGRERDVARVESVPLADALAEVGEEHAAELLRVWNVACTDSVPGKVWRIFGDLREHGQDVRTAWGAAWAIDACALRDGVDACGSTTREVISRTDGGERVVSLSRARCGGARCPHCGVLIVGARWRARLRRQAAVDQLAGTPWAMLTLTVDPTAWTAEHGVDGGLPGAMLAQRWAGRAFRSLARAIQRRWKGTVMLRAIELHESQWPHVHVLVRGGLVDAMAAEGERRGRGEWDEMATWAADQRARQRAGELRVARCPTPDTRAAVAALATAHGFGLRLDLSPVGWDAMERVGDYVSKGPTAQGRGKRIADVAAVDAITGELSKGKQRVDHLLARGVRCWAEAGAFLTVDDEDDEEAPRSIESVRVLPVPLDVLAAELRTAGEQVSGEVVQVDFSGAIPEKGQRRPRQVEAVAVSASPFDMLAELGRVWGLPRPQRRVVRRRARYAGSSVPVPPRGRRETRHVAAEGSEAKSGAGSG